MSINVNQCYSNLLAVLTDIKIPVPKKTAVTSRPPWVSGNLQTKRTSAWRQFKYLRRELGRNSYQVIQSWLVFWNLKLEFKSIVDVMFQCENELADGVDTKRSRAYLRQKKIIRPSVGFLLVEGEWCEDINSIANHLVDFSGKNNQCDTTKL